MISRHICMALHVICTVPNWIVGVCPQPCSHFQVPDPCIEPENRANAMIALDLDTGAFKWTVVLGGYSAWTYACLTPGNPNCPAGPGTDYDFGEAPMIITVGGRDLVVAGQKSGTVWALDPDNGDIVWSTVRVPAHLHEFWFKSS